MILPLQRIYRPVANELKLVDDCIDNCMRQSRNSSILAISEVLLECRGKRIRPALVILSERAASFGTNRATAHNDELITTAAAVELIHIASLIHDDVLDEATMRHGKPSINSRWGDHVSIVMGDYVHSKAFDLIGTCKNPDVFACISTAIYAMCEGELAQVCQRDNPVLSKEDYMVIIRKKTATLFAACCRVGAIIGGHDQPIQIALQKFGMNFGMAFQIIDDCRDIVSEEKTLGKCPGQDILVGDITLPVLNLLEAECADKGQGAGNRFNSEIKSKSITKIRSMVMNSDVLDMTIKSALSHIEQAKLQLNELQNSDYKESLSELADYISQKNF
jgi:geranylgeranyl pyrophosphate synthase